MKANKEAYIPTKKDEKQICMWRSQKDACEFMEAFVLQSQHACTFNMFNIHDFEKWLYVKAILKDHFNYYIKAAAAHLNVLGW